jgi:hypothetical protein
MKKKQEGTSKSADIRIPSIPGAIPVSDPRSSDTPDTSSTSKLDRNIEQDEPSIISNSPAKKKSPSAPDKMAAARSSDALKTPAAVTPSAALEIPAVDKPTSAVKTDAIVDPSVALGTTDAADASAVQSVILGNPHDADNTPYAPVTMNLGSHSLDYDDDDTDHYDSTRNLRISRTKTLYEPKQKKKTWVKPMHFLIPVIVVVLVILFISIVKTGNLEERLASPMTLNGESISHAEFSFMYHYILLENGIDISEPGTKEMLEGPGENGFATLREFFLDMAAREIQRTQILYDDAVLKGYTVNDSHRLMAQAYIDWLSVKANEFGVSLEHYIEGYYGTYVTKEQIYDTLSKIYFADEYASGPKLEELRASDTQAEEAYAESPHLYDLVSYRVLRIVYEQTDDNFKATAHLRAQEIIDGIGHDPLQFESVAANFFTGAAKDAILVPDSTLIPYVRYSYVEDIEWRAWLFDPARTPGDCTIFDDENGFPILFCFSERTRQLDPLRNVRLFYLNREDTAAGLAGVPELEILPLAQSMLDSVTDEASMQLLETSYADDINAFKMKAVHKADSYRGELSEDLDAWIFDPARVSGDKTILESDTQVILVYYVDSSPNPEWFDRVNSFIRMNNYQAFLLEKQFEYPYEFNQDGINKISDVAW